MHAAMELNSHHQHAWIEHVPAMPEQIMNSLFTCIAKTKGRRRCLRPKFTGLDYCSIHCDPSLLTEKKRWSRGKSKWRGTLRNRMRITLSSIRSDAFQFLRNEITPRQRNLRLWNVSCIEDSILCQSKAPFPLGLRVSVNIVKQKVGSIFFEMCILFALSWDMRERHEKDCGQHLWNSLERGSWNVQDGRDVSYMKKRGGPRKNGRKCWQLLLEIREWYSKTASMLAGV